MRPVAAALVLVSLAACAGEAPPPAPEINADRALAYAEAQVAFGPRIPGTPAHAATAAWIDSVARTLADTVQVQRWTHVTAEGDSLPLVNVLAQFNPSATTRLLYVAHWDTRPRADAPTSTDSSVAVLGANDGASGVAVLLAVAEALKAAPPAIGVDLLFVDGEDYGHFGPPRVDVLIGSTYYAANQLAPRPTFAVVWDMVGAANAKFQPEDYSMVAAPAAVEEVWSTAEAMGYGHLFTRQRIGGIVDDHVPLIDKGIRAIDVIGWPYAHWHTPDDTADKLDRATLEAVGNVAVGVVRRVGMRPAQ